MASVGPHSARCLKNSPSFLSFSQPKRMYRKFFADVWRIPPLVAEAKGKKSACVILLHGVGYEGKEWTNTINYLGDVHNHIKFIAPTPMPVSMTSMRENRVLSWMDVKDIHRRHMNVDDFSLKRNTSELEALIEKEIAAGVKPERIVFVGFSVGAAMSMHFVYSNKNTFGGCMAFSGFLPELEQFHKKFSSANKSTPLCIVHGEKDYFFPIEWARETDETLRNLGVPTEFKSITKGEHSLLPIHDILINDFIKVKLPA
eukprot:TRINITY_DN4384_c0_g1_i1.p1 TRINITY_DN4384_c0_g1~~TRINITY_DN4384_c0_g1_i1.p1  ORF type:complete len:258 (-),score=33.53 TRINITY_DN4384_c0_g1_i1:275-1048(-)